MTKIQPMAVDTPIEVPAGTVTSAVMALLRYLVALVVAVAVSREWIKPDSAEGIGAILLAILTTGYGIFNTWRRKKQLVVAADAAPDAVAVVKP